MIRGVAWITILLIASCNDDTARSPRSPKDNSDISSDSMSLSKDSAHETLDSSVSAEGQRTTILITREQFEFKNYVVAIKSKFILPHKIQEDSSHYFEKNYLVIYNKRTKATDSTTLQLDAYSPYRLEVADLSDSLKLQPLFLHISWTGDDDAAQDEFAGYDHGILKHLFSIPGVMSLQKKDQWTLTGFTSKQDDFVYNTEFDYPVTVSLQTYEVRVKDPAVQYIGYLTKAVGNIKMYKRQGLEESSSYTLKRGTRINVDTLYRTRNLIRIITSDSVILYGRPDKVKGKIKEETAG